MVKRKRGIALGLAAFVIFLGVLRYGHYDVVIISSSERDALARLSLELKRHPEKLKFKVSRTSSWFSLMSGVLTRTDGRRFEIFYNRETGKLEESHFTGGTQDWDRVSEAAIHAVAAKHGTFKDLAAYGARDVEV